MEQFFGELLHTAGDVKCVVDHEEQTGLIEIVLKFNLIFIAILFNDFFCRF